MNCLKLGNVFKCEYCKYVNISLILILFYLGQIISLNDAIKSANETKKLTNVSKNQLSKISIDLTNHLSDTSKIDASNSNSNSTTKINNNRNSTRLISKQNRQLEKHFYNITLPPVESTNHSLSTTKLIKTNSNKTLDEFDISESQNSPRISRFDEEPAGEEEQDQETEHQPQQQQQPFSLFEDDSVDGASSNLNEQKVVKELTKILSKGMSGATDQVKLDTLEQWKRRQRERKVVKDSRAKLFEDLLTAAINTHPEKVKKKTKKRNNKQEKDEQSNKQNFGSISPILSGYPNLDPELSADAETVIQHLQGLASVVDGSTPPFLSGNKLETSGDSSSGGDESSSSDNYSSSDATNTNDNDSPSEEKTSKKIVSSSSDRPIVKQFKQIKNKISQRRKQLDQIKKIFNVDLSLNKDGSLQGKTGSKKKETASSEVNEEYSNSEEGEASSSSTSKVKKKSSKKDKDKMQDLMNYLKENPEILASVMDELTANTEYSPTKLNPMSENDPLFQNSPQLDDNQLNYPSMSRKVYSTRQHPDYDTNNNNWDRAYRKPNRISSDIPSHDLANTLRRQRLRNNIAENFPQNDDNVLNMNANNRLIPLNEKPFSAEALLLESLRERQLMNLARLDRVLAERYQASNRSQVYSSLNRSGQTTLNFSPRSHLLPPSQQQQQQQQVTTATSDHRHGDVVDQMQRQIPNNRINNHPSANQRQYNQQDNTRPSLGQSDEEVLHHFMATNPPTHPYSIHDPVNDSIVQQQNQQLSKPYNPRLQQQSQQLQQFQQQQQQQQYPQLNRFRDWRDVSHSEASPSQRSDKTNFPMNATRPQFDLTTSAIDAHGSPSVHSNNYQLPSFPRTQSPTNDNHYDAKTYADSIVTKPGIQAINNNHQADNTIRPPGHNFIRDRPSVLRSESKSQPVVNANPYSETDLDDGDRKSSSRRRESISDDDELSERTRATNSNGPTDYFSAYKRTNQNGGLDHSYNNNNNRHEVLQTSNLKEKSQRQQEDLESDQNESESDGNDSGAMWAR